MARRYEVDAKLRGAIGDNPVLANDVYATILVANGPRTYQARRIPSERDGFALLASTTTAASVLADFALYAITQDGVGFSAQPVCMNPDSVKVLHDGDAIATCELISARFRVPATR